MQTVLLKWYLVTITYTHLQQVNILISIIKYIKSFVFTNTM